MGISTLSLLGAMLSTYFNYKSASTPIPSTLRLFVFNGLAKFFFIKPTAYQNDIEKSKLMNLDDTDEDCPLSKNSELRAIVKELKLITTILAEKEKEDLVLSEWKLLAKIVDRFLFLVAVIIFLVSLIYIYC